MNSSTHSPSLVWAAALAITAPTPFIGSAYPPAPDYQFYGLVRNEWGDPLNVNGASVFVTSTNATSAIAPIATSRQPGINYRLIVPMDSARSPKGDPAPFLSLRQSQAFQLKVQIGATTYLPIEMILSRQIGEPAGTARLDLTLGVDSDGDGLPDAWELANGLNPNDPNDADGDADGDGLSNRKEYMAGTFAFDPNDGFRLTLTGMIAGASEMEFLAIRGRTYRIQASANLQQWTPVDFGVLTGNVPGALQSTYPAPDVRMLKVRVPFQPDATNRFFRAMVQ
jgi:hypothetical protein